MAYIGHSPTNAGNFYILDDFNGLGQDGSSSTYDQNANGTIVNYKLMVAGVAITPNVDNLFVTIDGVVQHPTDAYSISGSILTFTEAPASGVDFHCFIMGQSATVGEGSIGADELKVSGDGTSGQLLKSDGDGTMSWINQNTVTASTANVATHVTVADNESTNENNLLTFVEDASGAGNVGLESDGDLHYNPSTGRLTATQLAGTLQTAAQTNITSLSTALVANGSAGSPSHSFSNNADSGMYSPADNQLAFASGGTQALIFGGDQSATFASSVQSTRSIVQDDMGAGRDTGMNLRSTNSSGYGFAVNFQADDGTDDDRIVARLYSEPNNATTSDFRIATRSGGTLANRLTIEGNNATFAGAITMTTASDTILNIISTATNGKEYEIQSTDAGNLTFVRRTGSAAEILRFTGSDDSATFSGDVRIGGTSLTPSGDKDQLVVESTSHGGMSALGPDASEQGFFTGHASSTRVGEFHTRYDTNTMTIGSAKSGMQMLLMSGNRATALTLDSSQNATFDGYVGIKATPGSDTTLTIHNSDSSDNSYIIDGKHTATNANGYGARFSTVATGSGRDILTLRSGASGSEVSRFNFRADGSSVQTGDILQSGNHKIGSASCYIKVNPIASDLMLYAGNSSAGDVQIFGRRNVNIYDIDDSNALRFLFATYDGTAEKSSGAGDWVATSDARLKKNVKDLSLDALAILNSLRPVEFKWKNEKLHQTPKDSKGNTYGFIADEIQSVMPQMVNERELPENSDDRKYVDEDGIAKATELGHMASLYIKAIQQLTTRLEALENA